MMRGAVEIRLFVVDDHPIVIEGLVGLFDRVEGIDVVGSASTLDVAQTLIDQLDPDVVLLDVRIGKTTSFSFAEKLVRRSSTSGRPKVALFTSYDDPEFVSRAAHIHVNGFLYKNASPTFLVQALRDIAHGEYVVSPEFGATLLGETGAPQQPQLLAGEDMLILKLIANGNTTKAIAETVHMSERTVKRRVNAILSILGATTRAEAVSEAYRLGIL